jgi:menaquinone-dependent protoporphyrinogen IX oxidase
MVIFIVHDSQYGNGEKIANEIKKELESDIEVKVSHIRETEVDKIVSAQPTAIIIGTAVRMFHTSVPVKKWLKKLSKELKKNQYHIPFGAVFITHLLTPEKMNGFFNRFLNRVKKLENIKKIHDKFLSFRVKDIEGPLVEGALETAAMFGKSLKDIIKKY